jgi:hypothetical protein
MAKRESTGAPSGTPQNPAGWPTPPTSSRRNQRPDPLNELLGRRSPIPMSVEPERPARLVPLGDEE